MTQHSSARKHQICPLLEFYLFLVPVDIDQVEREDVVFGADQQSPSFLIEQESVVARAVGQAVKGDEVTGL